jgi:hypothetical protein
LDETKQGGVIAVALVAATVMTSKWYFSLLPKWRAQASAQRNWETGLRRIRVEAMPIVWLEEGRYLEYWCDDLSCLPLVLVVNDSWYMRKFTTEYNKEMRARASLAYPVRTQCRVTLDEVLKMWQSDQWTDIVVPSAIASNLTIVRYDDQYAKLLVPKNNRELLLKRAGLQHMTSGGGIWHAVRADGSMYVFDGNEVCVAVYEDLQSIRAIAR